MGLGQQYSESTKQSNEAVKQSIGYTAADSKDWNWARSDTKGIPSVVTTRAMANEISVAMA